MTEETKEAPKVAKPKAVKKVTAKPKAAPKRVVSAEEKKEATFPADATVSSYADVYEQGRFAARNGVSIDEAPHPDGVLKNEWVKGYKFEKNA